MQPNESKLYIRTRQADSTHELEFGVPPALHPNLVMENIKFWVSKS